MNCVGVGRLARSTSRDDLFVAVQGDGDLIEIDRSGGSDCGSTPQPLARDCFGGLQSHLQLSQASFGEVVSEGTVENDPAR